MKADWADVIILLGAVLFVVGLGLLDWRAALVGGGLLLMLMGSARLKIRR